MKPLCFAAALLFACALCPFAHADQEGLDLAKLKEHAKQTRQWHRYQQIRAAAATLNVPILETKTFLNAAGHYR